MGRLLIVEDELAVRDTLSELIGKDGREIVTASDGQEALACLTEFPRPCLILLDLMMPIGHGGGVIPLPLRPIEETRMNGWEFLQRKRADPLIAAIPTIVLSSSRRPAGAVHQLAKPVDVERLMALIDQYC